MFDSQKWVKYKKPDQPEEDTITKIDLSHKSLLWPFFTRHLWSDIHSSCILISVMICDTTGPMLTGLEGMMLCGALLRCNKKHTDWPAGSTIIKGQCFQLRKAITTTIPVWFWWGASHCVSDQRHVLIAFFHIVEMRPRPQWSLKIQRLNEGIIYGKWGWLSFVESRWHGNWISLVLQGQRETFSSSEILQKCFFEFLLMWKY